MKKIVSSTFLLFFLSLNSLYAHNFQNRNGVHIGCRPQSPVIYYVPVYPILIQPQETIYVDIVTAEGLNSSDGRYRRIQFYIGICRDGRIWCQAGVTPGRFQTEQDAYRFVERMSCLRDFSLREVYRYRNGNPWYISN